ncbi:HSP90 family protein [Carnobacterium gallinarum]|uniref:HSP90 family protein n=1 Tax=Carnobacterium gallinarum TaxID=2749 RepID=UPI0005587B98|nr:HSP90 family protein [Carnobacterium gallinarum]
MSNEENRFKVNLTGMIDILSNHLYNNKDVYLRELLQNATDAIRARKLITPNFSGEIHISLSKQMSGESTLIIEDNGIGLTQEEIHQFLATIAQSSKGDKKFQQHQNFIGRFGIGLLSCFIIADEIVMVTTSAKTNECFEWRGKADGTYEIRQLATLFDEPGTKIYLTSRNTGNQHDLEELTEQLEPDNLAEILFKYGACLEVPIYFSTQNIEQFINKETLALGESDDFKSLSHEKILELGELLLKEEFQDYFFIQTKNGKTKGIAYIVPYTLRINAKKRNTVFLNQMFVSDQVDVILPNWAFFTRCIIWTSELQPIASREDFYLDNHLKTVAKELGSSLKLGIETLPSESLEKLITAHFLSFKALASEDSEFLKMIYTFLPFRTLNGEEILADILTQNKMIHYALSVDDFRQMADLARTQGMTVINGGYSYDSQLLSEISLILKDFPFSQLKVLQPEDFQKTFHPLTFSESNELKEPVDELNQYFQELNLMIIMKHFEPMEMPMLLLSNHLTQNQRELERTAEESNDLFGGILEDLMVEKTQLPPAKLYLNMDNSLIQRLFNSDKKTKSLKNIIEVLYVQALLLGHYPLKKKELALLNNSLIDLLTQLI